MDTILNTDFGTVETAILRYLQKSDPKVIQQMVRQVPPINWYTHRVQPMPLYPNILGRKGGSIIWDDFPSVPKLYPFKLKVPNSVFFMDHIDFHHRASEGKDDTTILAFSTRSQRDRTMYRLIANGADSDLVKPTSGKR